MHQQLLTPTSNPHPQLSKSVTQSNKRRSYRWGVTEGMCPLLQKPTQLLKIVSTVHQNTSFSHKKTFKKFPGRELSPQPDPFPGLKGTPFPGVVGTPLFKPHPSIGLPPPNWLGC